MQDFSDAVQILEEEERRRAEHQERERKRLKEERDRVLREKQLARERARKEEEERLEQQRLEEERQRREQEELAEKARLEQIEKDIATTEPYREEVFVFVNALAQRRKTREEQIKQAKKERNIWEQERIKRQFARAKQEK